MAEKTVTRFFPGRSGGGEVEDLMESCLDGPGPQMAQVQQMAQFQCCRLPTPPLTGNPAPGGQKVHRRPGSTDGLGPQTARVHRRPGSTDSLGPQAAQAHRWPRHTDGPGPQTARVHRQPRSTDGPGPQTARWGWPKKWCIWTGWRWPKTSWVLL